MASIIIEKNKSAFNDVVVERDGTRVDMNVEGAVFATYDENALMTGYSWDALSAAVLLHKNPKSLLLLGLGGGTVLRQVRALLSKLDVVAVEIDADIVRLAQKHMALSDAKAEVHIADAYDFIEGEERQFDVVIDDIYLTGKLDVERPRVLEESLLENLCARLTPSGILVANLIVDRGHMGVRSLIHDAFLKRFSHCKIVRPPRGLNEIIVGSMKALKSELPVVKKGLLSDEDRELFAKLVVEDL